MKNLNRSYIKFIIPNLCEHMEELAGNDSFTTFYEYVKSLIYKFDSRVVGLYPDQIIPEHFYIFGFSIKDCCKIINHWNMGNDIQLTAQLLIWNGETYVVKNCCEVTTLLQYPHIDLDSPNNKFDSYYFSIHGI